jgi:uncharacterized protein
MTRRPQSGKRSSDKRRQEARNFPWLLFLGAFALFGVYLFIHYAFVPDKESLPLPVEDDGGVSARRPSPAPAVGKTPTGLPLPEGRFDLAIVLDDFGDDLEIARRAVLLPRAVTFAVLPFLRYSNEISALAAAAGHEVILHLPMEPHNYPAQDPGEGALLLGAADEDILLNFTEALDHVPAAVGVNNHMGSAFTEDADRMRFLLSRFNALGLFFLDSRTSPHTVGEKVARELGVPCARRDVFLDNAADPKAIAGQFRELLELAQNQGHALAIGHARPLTVTMLPDLLAGAREAGFNLVPVAEYIRRHGEKKR